jgi:hypothetical protein
VGDHHPKPQPAEQEIGTTTPSTTPANRWESTRFWLARRRRGLICTVKAALVVVVALATLLFAEDDGLRVGFDAGLHSSTTGGDE